MGLIRSVDPRQANGKIKETFTFFKEAVGTIPALMTMFSVSPDIFKLQLQSIKYFRNHPTLNASLLSTIRYLVARIYDYQFCTEVNQLFLETQGLSHEDLEMMTENPENAPLNKKDRAMLAFVVKAVKSPDSISSVDMRKVHSMGWTDRDVLDAMVHAGSMITSSVLMKAFKLDEGS